MDLGFATIVVLSLLAPGFGMVSGMRVASRFDIKIGKQSHTAEIIMLLLLASVLHILFFPAYRVFAYLIFSFDLWDYLKTYTVPVEGGFLDLTEWLYLFLYVPFSGGLAFFLGMILIKAVEQRFWFFKTELFHGSMYNIISGKLRNLIRCSVLTNLRYGSCYLMYRGILAEVSYSAGYTIEYVSLINVEKYLVKVDPNTMEVMTGGPKSVVTYQSSIGDELFAIDKSNIVNVLFTKDLPPLQFGAKQPYSLNDIIDIILIVFAFFLVGLYITWKLDICSYCI